MDPQKSIPREGQVSLMIDKQEAVALSSAWVCLPALAEPRQTAVGNFLHEQPRLASGGLARLLGFTGKQKQWRGP